MTPAKYTVVLKTLLDSPEAKNKIDRALSTYPLYEPSKLYDMIPNRETLNKKLLNHYKYREIFCSAPGRFIDDLEIAMCEIMPHYNELLKTIEIMADLPSPFDNVDVVETFEQERNDTSTNNTTTSATANTATTSETTSDSTATNNAKHLEADTPQNEVIAPENISGVTYASMAKWDKDTTETTDSTLSESEATTTEQGTAQATNESSGTVKHTMTKKGNQGVNTYAHDMNEFRTSIMDVVTQIINDPRIQELFFMLY